MSDADDSAAPRRFESTRIHGNKHGYRGVEWDASRQKYRARIEPAAAGRRGRFLGRFWTAEQAARAYDEAARVVYGAKAYLNFPEAGELKAQATRAIDKNLCPQGHDLTLHGRTNTQGRFCAACQRAAVTRYYRKNHPQP